MSAPWTEEQAKKWAEQWCDKPRCAQMNRSDKEWHRHKSTFLAGLAKAAEMIEASPTVFCDIHLMGKPWTDIQWSGTLSTHQAKLVNVKPIEKGKSDE